MGEPPEPETRPAALTPHPDFWSLPGLLLSAGSILALDQLTKALVIHYLPLYAYWEPSPQIGRLFRIYHISNTGAAFGMFPDNGNIFIIIALVVALAIIYYYPRLRPEQRVMRIALGLQLGGALGNLIDRLRFGYVVDFLDIGFWAIFNVADAAIVLGVVTLAICLWQEEDG